MAHEYCTRAALYAFGAPRGVLNAPARLVATSTASTDVVELDDHGFVTDDPILFRAADGGTLSAPLVAGTTYYAIRLNDSTFKVAATSGGAAINLTTNGVTMIVSIALPFDRVIEFYSRWADSFFPAHAVPFTAGAVPVIVEGLVAQLAAKRLAALAGHTSEAIDAAEVAAMAQLERFAKGLPVRDANATARTNTAAVSSYVTTGVDPRGWPSGSLP